MSFSILILTLNEEPNLPDCLQSVSWCDDVVVLDSFSGDRTVEIARAAGALVLQRVFDDFARQRNYALDQVGFKHDWIFHLDADERCTGPLRQECERAVREDALSGYLVPSKTMFMGKWLRWAGMYPSYQMRLLKRGEVRFIQHGHGQREAEAKRGLGVLRQPYLHYNFAKGLADWIEKHNRYSTQEAEQNLKSAATPLDSLRLLFTADKIARRRALKSLSRHLPLRPTFRFLYMYLLRLGFLDGLPGYRYCRLLAIYECMIALKASELRRRRRGLPI